jgi:23S rRNA (adenine2503-C2)-methyltransferase
MSEKFDIKSASFEELHTFVGQLGEPAFRAKQIYEWMHVKQVTGIDEMTNLSKGLREKLKEQCTFTVLKPVDVQISGQDGTRKYLFGLADGNVIESVLMRYKHGNSVCISSQVGCRMGCRFCASTLDGLERNLTPAEMLEQIYRIGCDIGERISNVVVMGSGEPLDNYENLLKFIRMLTDEQGLHISQRNVTVSTCGLVEKMRELADEKLAITLALSLHASSQEKRLALMPVANKYALEDVLGACDYYFARTGRRMTYEYSLVGGVNDTDEDLMGLVGMLKGRNCHINLIPVNPIKERTYVQSDRSLVERFQKKLEQQGINATVRREMGRDIDGACGQLRRRYMDEKKYDRA